MKNFFKVLGLVIISIVVIALIYVAIYFPPVMAGMAAKTMCSCVFIGGRTPESVKAMELQVFPGLSSADFVLNRRDSTVEARIAWKTTKSIFREGLGCTLLSEASEAGIRGQRLSFAKRQDHDAMDWPDGDHTSPSIVNNGVNMSMINEAIAGAFTDIDASKPKNTLAVVVLHNGQIIGERYADGFYRNSRFAGWSMAKSITSALIGILVKERKLSVEENAPVAAWRSDERNDITINNLLQANSGLAWSESYFVPTSTFHNMFILSDDKGGYASDQKLKYAPGKNWLYSSGSTNILSKIIHETVGDSTYYRFPYEQLFYKIGMNHTLLEVDASGTFVGSSYCFASARDWARFGLLYLHDGVWNGERILPEGWVKYTTMPSPAAKIGQYGAQWWLNVGEPDDSSNRKYPTLPTDAYWADGFEQQWVMVIPSSKLVIVRLGVSHHGSDFVDMTEMIIRAVSTKE
ncbi:MAG: serine hydrolase [Chryseolinea sp.]